MNKVFSFVLGAAIGSLVTWKLVEKKYKEMADEEINAVREYYRNKYNMLSDQSENMNNDENLNIVESRIETKNATTDITNNHSRYIHSIEEIKEPEYNKMLNELGYTDEEMKELLNDPDVVIEQHGNDYEIYLEPEEKDIIEPYVISPEEYGEYDTYETKSLTYYGDFVLADESGEIISEPEDIIGNALAHFGEYEDDAVHVRNKNIKCDYEILKNDKTFSEIYGSEMNV